jgi:phosphopantetheinyl transferase (holo-ACP synthase)
MMSWVVPSVPAKAVANWRSIDARVNSPDIEYKNRTVHGQPSVELEGRTYAALRTFQGATSAVFMSTDQNRMY